MRDAAGNQSGGSAYLAVLTGNERVPPSGSGSSGTPTPPQRVPAPDDHERAVGLHRWPGHQHTASLGAACAVCGVGLQLRSDTNDPRTTFQAGPWGIMPPYWVRLVRTGSEVRGWIYHPRVPSSSAR